MSLQLINLNSDLKRLRDEGYFIQVKNGFLIMRDVPYVNSNRHVCRGTIISSLSLAGDRTRIPDTHVVHFDGDMPCNAEGGSSECCGTPELYIRFRSRHYC